MYKIYEFYKEPCDDKSECLLYTVYAFNKTGETINVYPMRVFTDYRDALDEALKFGSFCNDYIFLVDTNIYNARINYTIHHADRVNAQYSVHNADDDQGIWNELKVLSAEDRNIIKTEENCYYSDGVLYLKEIREYYDTGDMDKEEASKDET